MQKSSKLEDFQIISRLAEGSFSHVFKVKHKSTSQIFALKKIKTQGLTDRDKKNSLNQIRILASNQGKNIIGYKDSFYDEITNCLCVVIQFAEQGDLSKKIQDAKKSNKNIEQAQIWRAMAQITLGLKTLHVKKIIHRDLKPANIFIMNDGTYKLGDLNISRVLKSGLAKTQTGTPYYTSPEIWNNRSYGVRVDIWSLGCVLYEMATKRPPFLGNNVDELRRKICVGSFPKIPSTYSEQLRSMINSMLRQNPSYRPLVNQILNNPALKTHYEPQIYEIGEKNLKLINTIKIHEGNWKKINLPKSRYECSEKDQSQIVKRQISFTKIKQKQGVGEMNSRSSRVSILSIYKQKNKEVLHNKEIEKVKELKEIKNAQKQRNRIFSACGPERANKYLKQNLIPQKPNQALVNELPPKPLGKKQKENYPTIHSNISRSRSRSKSIVRSKVNVQNAGEKSVRNTEVNKTLKK